MLPLRLEDLNLAAAERQLGTLVIVGADPLRDHPNAKLAEDALANAGHVVVIGLELGDMAFHADVFLPAAASIEREGSRTTWEGRSQPFHAVTFAGRRFDCGSKAGFVEATLSLALERPDMADDVRAIMKRLLSE